MANTFKWLWTIITCLLVAPVVWGYGEVVQWGVSMSQEQLAHEALYYRLYGGFGEWVSLAFAWVCLFLLIVAATVLALAAAIYAVKYILQPSRGMMEKLFFTSSAVLYVPLRDVSNCYFLECPENCNPGCWGGRKPADCFTANFLADAERDRGFALAEKAVEKAQMMVADHRGEMRDLNKDREEGV